MKNILKLTPKNILGWRVSEISSLTLVSTPAPSLVGGCGDVILNNKTTAQKRGLFEINSADGKTCLMDAILFSIFGVERFREIRKHYEPDCPATTHTPLCQCYNEALKVFNVVASRYMTLMKWVYCNFVFLQIKNVDTL